jgi:IS5 family transposase
LLLQVLYTIRSERMLMEQLDYNLLFRWFVRLSMDDPIWDATVFTKNRGRLLEGEIARAFFQEVLALASEKNLTSDEHFTVDGTLIEAWAGHKSFRPRPGRRGQGGRGSGGSRGEDFHGQTRSNTTHQSTTDPEARLARKGPGKEARLSYLGHVLMENRNGLVVDARLTQVDGLAERSAAEEMLRGVRATRRGRVSVGADKGYDTRDFVSALRAMGITPDVAQNDTNRRSAIDGRTTRHVSYQISQRKRKLIEQVFGWLKTVGGLRKTRHRGAQRVGWMFVFSMAAFDLIRIAHLETASP